MRQGTGHSRESGDYSAGDVAIVNPYIKHDGAFASLDSPEEVFTVGINRAVTLLAERKGLTEHLVSKLLAAGEMSLADALREIRSFEASLPLA